MPSFQDSIVLFVLALLLFGPKKLPQLARELGKWVGEFRRASNEFKMQMEEELRMADQAERQKQAAAIEAAAPVTPALPAESLETAVAAEGEQQILPVHSVQGQDDNAVADAVEAKEPLPIAVSGDLKIMPPATGLPTPQNGSQNGSQNGALAGLLEAIPETSAAEEGVLHGD
jgi:sec-independent protein translocase protein TatB